MIYALTFIFLTALSTNFTQYLIAVNGIPCMLALAVTSFFAIVYFHLINIKQLKNTYQLIITHWQRVLLINVEILGVWVCTYYSNFFAGSNAVVFTLGISTAIIPCLLGKHHIKLMAILVVLALFFIFNSNHDYLLGGSIGIIGGLFSYFYLRDSAILAQQGNFSAKQILCVRFYLLMLFSLTLSYRQLPNLHIHQWGQLFLLTLMTLTIPLYFSQQAVVKLGAKSFSLIITFIPIATFIIEYLVFGKWLHSMLVLSMLVPIVLNLSLLKNLTIKIT